MTPDNGQPCVGLPESENPVTAQDVIDYLYSHQHAYLAAAVQAVKRQIELEREKKR